MHARTQAIRLFMRMRTNRGMDSACRALRYIDKLAVEGIDVFLMLQEEEPEMVERQPWPRDAAT